MLRHLFNSCNNRRLFSKREVFWLVLLSSSSLLLSGCLNWDWQKASSTTTASASEAIMFGDGLTQGGQDSSKITIGTTIKDGMGYSTDIAGVGSQISTQIGVRANAFAGTTAQTFAADFVIPTTGNATVQFQTNYEPCARVVQNVDWNNIYQSGVPILFTVSGTSYSGKCFSDSSSTVYTFIPDSSPKTPVTVPAGTAWTTVLPASAQKCWILWIGRDDPWDATTTLNNIAATVASAKANSKTGCYVVLGLVNSFTEPSGSAAYNRITKINAALASTYGTNYIPVRENLVSAYDPSNGIDVINHQQDTSPFTLHAAPTNGSFSAALSATSCQFSVGSLLPGGWIMQVGSEYIYIQGGVDGNYYCVRGYGNSTAASYNVGQTWNVVDPWHLGRNPSTPAAQSSGYAVVGKMIVAWLKANSK